MQSVSPVCPVSLESRLLTEVIFWYNISYNNMIIKEIQPKTILSISKVYPYVINPYVGCQHNCSYRYARFMKRFSGHREPWDEFVEE